MSNSNTWPLATKEKPCVVCGKDHSCRNAPDGTAAVCWHDGNGGKVIQLGKPHQRAAEKTARRLVAAYEYTTGEGDLIAQALRYDPKTFRQRRPDGKGGWVWSTTGIDIPLYRLPNLLNAREDRPDDWHFVTEGEKDVDNLIKSGLVATCNIMGAGKWRDQYSDQLQNRRVCIIADKDAPGRQHAQQVAASLNGKAACVRVVELPGNHVKDASDFLSAGGAAEQIIDLADAAEDWTPGKSDKLSDLESVNFTDLPAAETPAEDVLTFSGLTIGDLIDTCPELRPVIIDGVLRQGETMNVIAAPKMGKSWLVLGLVLSLITGRQWMGFETKPCRVLLIDNELHPETLARRVARVAEAMSIDREEYATRLCVQPLRGQLKDWYALRSFFATIPAGEFGVIVCDAFYRFAPKDTDENDNGSMAAIYNMIDAYADMTKAGFVLIHHTTKGIQAGKSVTDIGAGAGAQSRATDTHLVLRQHKDDGVAVLDAAVRSFAPVEPRCVRWEYPLWHPAPYLDPEDLKTDNRRKRKDQPEAEVVETKPKAEPWTVKRFVENFITSKPQGKASIMAHAEGLDIPVRKAEQLFKAGIESGVIHEWPHPIDKRAKRYANTAPTLTDLTPSEVA